MKRLTATKLFIDGGDPAETADATRLLREAGYERLDGQTTNPSLVAKNPDIAVHLATGNRLTQEELLVRYRQIVQGMERSASGSISIEVYADWETTAAAMIEQARQLASWSSSAVIKLPITSQGLLAAEQLKGEMRLNLTLCFSQEQAAAVYLATKDSAYPVYLSPFIGRLDDRGENGMQLIENILRMYQTGDGHVDVLAASIRGVDHILAALQLGVAAITMPYGQAFLPWAQQGFPLPSESYSYHFAGMPIPYRSEIPLQRDWRLLDVQHELTDVGLQKFADDWNSLIGRKK